MPVLTIWHFAAPRLRSCFGRWTTGRDVSALAADPRAEAHGRSKWNDSSCWNGRMSRSGDCPPSCPRLSQFHDVPARAIWTVRHGKSSMGRVQPGRPRRSTRNKGVFSERVEILSLPGRIWSSPSAHRFEFGAASGYTSIFFCTWHFPPDNRAGWVRCDAFRRDVDVALRRLVVRVTEKNLNDAYICSCLIEVRREAVSESVHRHLLAEAARKAARLQIFWTDLVVMRRSLSR